MIRLGPFELRTSLATGSAGEVWQAVHRSSGVEVALKVIRGSRAAEERYRVALRQEIRAMARLDHPGIVGIVDHGEVGAAAEAASEGRLRAGSPWLAMELVPGGSIYPLSGTLTWEQVRRVMRGLLPALGHAHARGVLHRDVKPANVLLASEATLRVRLTDFGVAHPIARGAPAGPAVAGTPGFMAPEQREGRWRDFGPWTDLYGLGKTCEFLLRGKEGSTPEVPAGYEAWLGHLLAEEPAHRFRVAADALAELEALGRPTVALGSTPTTSGAGSTFFDLDSLPLEPESDGGGATVAPTVATGWRPEAWADERFRNEDAGLRLAMLRVPPLVGRSVERERLWTLLGTVRQAPRVVVLEGQRGVGKTRLARWLAEAAFEMGMGGPVFAVHSEQDSPGDGVRGSLARLFGFGGLAAGAIERRAREVVRLWGLPEALAEPVLCGVFGARAALDPKAMERGLVQIVGWLATLHRPVVLVVDDAERSRQSIEVVAGLMEGRAPVLAVCTCAQQPDWMARRLAGAEVLAMGPPDAVAHRAILRGLLPLDAELTGRITELTLGDVRRAVSLVRALADQGQLRPGADGFTLAAGVVLDRGAGDDGQRLDRFLGSRSPDDAVALELCAVTGAVVDPAEHRAMLEVWGARPAERWLDDAAEAGLLRLDIDGGWQLADGLREALRDRSAGAGRLERAHEVRAEVLEAGGGERGVVGLHLSEAGSLERALEALEQGVQQDLQRGAFHRARQWVREWQRVAVRAGLPTDDERNGQMALLDLMVDLGRDRFDRLERGLDVLASRASALGWARVGGSVLWLRGRVAYLQGRQPEARRWLERGLAVAEAEGDGLLLARCCADLGRSASVVGQTSAALPWLERSWEAYEALDHPSGLNLVAGELSDLHRGLGDLEAAHRWASVAAAVSARLGGAGNLSDAAMLLGEVARARGDLDAAEDHYRAAIRLLTTSVRFEHADAVQLNLTLVRMERGDWPAAMAMADRCIDTYETDSREWLKAAAHVLALAPAAGLGQADAFGRYLVRAEALLVRTGFVAPDVIRALELAREQAEARGWTGEVAQLDALIAEQHQARRT